MYNVLMTESAFFFEETTESAVEKKIKAPFPNLYFLCFAFFFPSSYFLFPHDTNKHTSHCLLLVYIWEPRQEINASSKGWDRKKCRRTSATAMVLL